MEIAFPLLSVPTCTGGILALTLCAGQSSPVGAKM
jgi:hypothetical protein